MMFSAPFALVSILCSLVSAAPSSGYHYEQRQVSVGANPYAPRPNTCPSTALVRPAIGLNSNEVTYIAARKVKASAALSSWLARQGKFNTTAQPTVGFISSGGGNRALLCTAGVVQGFDARDSNLSVNGLYQSFTYEGGLSGGSWFLSSLAGNNWPTVSYLKTNLWENAFQNTLLLPANLANAGNDAEVAAVTNDIQAKQTAGYNVTIIDAWGRLLSYQLLLGPDGGVSNYLSGLTGLSNFTSYNVPYPIQTTIGVLGYQGQCDPPLNATQYEFHPYEYGSWDSGVSAFAQTQYMGTSMANGAPAVPGQCVVHYDNMGYVLSTSSNVFFAPCVVAAPDGSATASEAGALEHLLGPAHTPVFQDLFGIYPNPFYHYNRSSMVYNDPDLTMVDGGSTDQNNPIWPFIQPARDVSVLLVNDNSADTSDNFPNGTEIWQTYQNAKAVGLKKMPYIPPVSTFVQQGLNKRATFFGCNETGTTFIVYLPNVAYTFPSGEPTAKLEYMKSETDGMIANGMQIANQNGTAGWSFCLACAIRNKDGAALPKSCNTCFQKYCYYRSGTSG